MIVGLESSYLITGNWMEAASIQVTSLINYGEKRNTLPEKSVEAEVTERTLNDSMPGCRGRGG